MVEGAPLLREYTSKAYRGFESHLLRHFDFQSACRVLPSDREFWSLGRQSLAVAVDKSLPCEERESPAGITCRVPVLGGRRKRIGERTITLSGTRIPPATIGFCQKDVTNVSKGACPAPCRSRLSVRKIRLFLTNYKGNRGRLPDLCPFSNRTRGRLPQTPHWSKLVIA